MSGSSAEGATFDVREYAAKYADGGLKIKRLLHVVEATKDVDTKRVAEKMVVDSLQETMRVDLYQDVMSSLGSAVDEAWVAETTKRSNQTLSQLEQEFGMAKTQLRKDETRLAVRNLGLYYQQCGRLMNSVKFFIKMRDFCKNAEEILDMCLLVIEVGIENDTWSVVNQHCARAEQADSGRNKVALGKVLIALALSLLDCKKYKPAAMKLLDVPIEVGDSFSQVLCAQDIASYACLLALATFSRAQLKERFIDTTPFRAYLELAPRLTQLVKGFYESDYSCLSILKEVKESMRMDLFLHSHVDDICDAIWTRALKQYTSPYMSVDFAKMSKALHTPVPELEKSVAKLIVDGQISARIDSANKILYAKRGNARQTAFNKAVESGRRVVLSTEDQLRRLGMVQSNFEYRHPVPENTERMDGM